MVFSVYTDSGMEEPVAAAFFGEAEHRRRRRGLAARRGRRGSGGAGRRRRLRERGAGAVLIKGEGCLEEGARRRRRVLARLRRGVRERDSVPAREGDGGCGPAGLRPSWSKRFFKK